jgi:nucleotide-binding universal stress UspA family protein
VTTAQPELGEVVDGFRVEERIHSGGMGVIYRVSAVDRPAPPFPIIMKCPRLGPGEPAASVITYEVEQMVLAALTGAHVPRFVAAGDLARRAYIVMEYVEGRSLSHWTQQAPLPIAEVVRLGIAVAGAIHALHREDAIHLDVKPSNVILRPGGEAVLIDFGLAHHAHYPDLLAEEVRHAVGSAPYMAPEQVLGVRNDPRSDVFALGAILYELATGRLPFGSPTSRAGLRKRLYRDPVPPRAIVPDLPPWLQETVLHCLEVDADRRHASAAQVAFDLAHGDQVALTERASRVRRVAGVRQLFRWMGATSLDAPSQPGARPSTQLAGASIILAAVATAHTNEAQFEAQRVAVRRLLSFDEHSRLACVTVIKPAPELGNRDEDAATSQRIKHVILLRHWAEALELPASRLSFHVIESNDPAAALIEYARANQVDHIVIGGPPPALPLKGLLGTVSTKVAVEAPCTVTVVRSRESRPSTDRA